MTIEPNQSNNQAKVMPFPGTEFLRRKGEQKEVMPVEFSLKRKKEESTNFIIGECKKRKISQSLDSEGLLRDNFMVIPSAFQPNLRKQPLGLESSHFTEKNTSSFQSKLPNDAITSKVSTVAQAVMQSPKNGSINPFQENIIAIDRKLAECTDEICRANFLAIKGAYLQKFGAYAQSIQVLEEACSLNPKSVFAAVRLGESYRLTQQYNKSLGIFLSAIKLGEESAFLYSRSAAALFQAGQDLEKAKEFIVRSYKIKPADPFTINYARKLGVLKDLLQKGKKSAQKIQIHDPNLLFRMGFSESKKGFAQNALDIFNRILECKPDHQQSLVSRGEIFLSRGKYGEAKNDFERAFELDSNNSYALLGLANSCLMLGEQKRGVELLNIHVDQFPEIAIARIMRGEEYRKMQRLQEAYDDFGEAIKMIEDYIHRTKESHSISSSPIKNTWTYNTRIDDPLFEEYKKNLVYAYGRRGLVTYRINSERIEEAQRDLEKANEIDSKDSFVWSALGSIHYEEKRFDFAKYCLSKCLSLTPKHTHTLNILGEIFRLEKNYADAKTNFKKSIEANSNNSYAYERLGDIYRESKEFEKALKYLTKALELNPRSHFALSSRGDLFRGLNRLTEAYDDLNNALAIEKNAFTLSNLGEVYRMGGVENYYPALRSYTEAISIDSAFSFSYFCRAKLYAAYGKYDLALMDLTKCIELDAPLRKPGIHLALLFRANIYLFKEDYAKAEIDLKHAQSIAGKLPMVYRYWTMYWYKKGDLLKALQSITEAIDLDPNQAVHYGERSKIQLFLRNYQDAKHDVDKALAVDPHQTIALSVAGILYSLDKHFDKAVDSLEQAIKIDPNNGFSHAALGEIYHIQGDFPQALQELNFGIRCSPKSPLPYFLRGILHFEMEQYLNAIDDFERYQETSNHYFAPLAKSKDTLDMLVRCMRFIIFLKTSHAVYSKGTAEKYREMLHELNEKIPSVDLAFFREIPEGEVTEEVKQEIQSYTRTLIELMKKKDDLYALSSLSIPSSI